MAKSKSIQKEVKKEVLDIVDAFNKAHKTSFQMTFRGQFAYLAKTEEKPMANMFRRIIAEKMGLSLDKMPKSENQVIVTKLGRLKYNGQMDNWDFAVFRYSREFYDAEEFMFPGAEELNGKIEGALRAGMQLYP